MAAPPEPLVDEQVVTIDSELDELRRSLITGRWRAKETDHREPVELFWHHHSGGAAGARFTALLLCTDDRWWKASGRLVQALVATGLLDDAEIDDLADTFLHTDELRVEVLASWAGLRYTLDAEHDAGLLAAGSAVTAPDGSVDPFIPFDRRITPPLRRWAVERLLRRGLVTPAAVHDRGRDLDEIDRTALISGLLDASDCLADEDAARAVGTALASSTSGLRRTALKVLCARGEIERARRRGLADPAKAVRTWARRLPVGHVHE